MFPTLVQLSSRENSLLPNHLQGVWNDNLACRRGWTCDMHLDVNTQLNYWLTESIYRSTLLLQEILNI